MHRNVHLKIKLFPRKSFLILTLLCTVISAYAQDISIKGKIVNESSEPIPGATISVKGTPAGTTTNDQGIFELDNISKDASLVISNVGYEKREVSLNGKNNLTIILKNKTSELDQAVVIAYGTTTKRLNTGDVSTVTAEEIARQPVSNPLAALEGRVPGLVVTQNTGVPGGGFTVQIRGQNSLRNEMSDNGNLPLYIIDGVPFTASSLNSNLISNSNLYGGNPLSAINPSDIESISILKDADATAIYGSRGANGVVLITTKKGEPGKTKIDVNVNSGFGKVGRGLNLLNTDQYLAMRHEAFKNDGTLPRRNDYDINGVWDTTRFTNWQKLLIGGTAPVTNMQVSISGGSAGTQFLLSGGYHREGTVFPGNFNDRKGSVHLNLHHSSEDQRFSGTVSASYVTDNNNLSDADFTSSINLPPDAPALYDSLGNLNWQHSTWSNPFAHLFKKYNSLTDNLIANVQLNYQILSGLRLKTNLGYNQISTNEVSTNPLSSINPAFYSFAKASSVFSGNSIESWILEPQISYDRRIREGKLTVLLGATFQQNTQSLQALYASGFTSDALIEDIQAAANISVLNANYTEYRYASCLARVNYDWQEKYLLNLTGRRDASSRFGPGKQFGNFGSAGAAWIFSNEAFVKGLAPFLSFGKLRASYGTTGNDQIGDYGYLDSYVAATYPYQSAGLMPSRLFNPDYSWEITRKTELGLELGFLKDRILVVTSFYRNRSSSQLVGYPLSAVTGFTIIQSNLPATVQNTGIEAQLNVGIIKSLTGNFDWETSFNLTAPNNTLIAYPDLAASSYANTYILGQSLYIKKRYHYLGVNPQTGVYSFEDIDRDGRISYPNDLKGEKKIAMTLYGGWQNILSYKGFQITFLFQFVKQTALNYLSFFGPPGTRWNQPVNVLSRWKSPGDQTSIQRFSQNYGSPAITAYYNAQYSGYAIGDASFIRLKNASLSYELPGRWLNKLKTLSGRVYLEGQNLFTITQYQGMDPENANSQYLPPLRVLTAGLQFTF